MLPEKPASVWLAPKVVAFTGLLLALAAALASPEGRSWDEAAKRVWVPLPDWLVTTVVASLAISILAFLVMARPWRRMRQAEPEDTGEDEPEPLPRWLSALLLLLSLIQCA